MKNSLFLLLTLIHFAASAQTLDRVKYTATGISDMTYSDRYGLVTVGGFSEWGINAGTAGLCTETNDTPDPNFPRIYSRVENAISDGNGGWYMVGSQFSKINENDPDTYSFNGIVHIRADNTVDKNFNVNNPSIDWTKSVITRIAKYQNTLYVIGSFTSTIQSALFAFDAITGDAKPFPIVKVSNPASGLQNCLVHGRTLYLSGSITEFNQSALNRSLIAIDLTTNGLKNWGTFQNTNTVVWGGENNIVTSGNKILIGNRRAVSNGTISNIAAFDTLDGATPLWEKQVSSSAVLAANSQFVFFDLVGAFQISDGATRSWTPPKFALSCSQCFPDYFR